MCKSYLETQYVSYILNIGPLQAVLNLDHTSTLLWRCYNRWISYSDLKVNFKLSLSLRL